MKIKNLFFVVILLITIFSGCEDKDSIDQSIITPSKDIKRVLPTFKLTTTKNETITVKVTKDAWLFPEFKDKAILLNFFTTWCPPCKAEIPHLNSLQEKYKDDFQVISILIEKDKPNSFVEDFIKQYNVKYPITNTNVNFELASAVGGVKSIPTMFLFNKEGLVYQNYVGAVREEILNTDIKNVIGK